MVTAEFGDRVIQLDTAHHETLADFDKENADNKFLLGVTTKPRVLVGKDIRGRHYGLDLVVTVRFKSTYELEQAASRVGRFGDQNRKYIFGNNVDNDKMIDYGAEGVVYDGINNFIHSQNE